MEAMACGLPVIGTNWSGNTAFMTAENSYLIDYELRPIPEVGWREIPTYKGHQWAEPSVAHLKQLMRRVFEERAEATSRGELAREQVTAEYNRARVGERIAAEVARIQETQQPKALTLPPRTHPDEMLVAGRGNVKEA